MIFLVQGNRVSGFGSLRNFDILAKQKRRQKHHRKKDKKRRIFVENHSTKLMLSVENLRIDFELKTGFFFVLLQLENDQNECGKKHCKK